MLKDLSILVTGGTGSFGKAFVRTVLNTAPRLPVAADIRAILNAPDQDEHLLQKFLVRYQETEPKLVAWAEEAIPEGFMVFSLPASYRRRLRTTNLVERLSEEIRRRTRVARLFPNEASCLRLVSVVLMKSPKTGRLLTSAMSSSMMKMRSRDNRNYRKNVAYSDKRQVDSISKAKTLRYFADKSAIR